MATTRLTKREKALVRACKKLIEGYCTGECYKTENPYIRPYVKDGLKLLAEIEGVKDYLDVDWRTE